MECSTCPGSPGAQTSEEKLSVQEKPSFWSLESLESDIAADDKWRKWHKGNGRGRPSEDETELDSCPLPVAWGWSKLGVEGNRHTCCLCGSWKIPSQMSHGHSNRLG